ncbi:MAG: hypothetical protein EXS36_04200 [Pedosphaera sp.]|nr:hypothetical protein [Pedosphaera sp.]
MSLSLILVSLLLSHHFILQHIAQVKFALARDRASVNSSHQTEIALDQLAKRIARGSDTDPRLTNILVKYGLNVTFEIDGKKKSYP